MFLIVRQKAKNDSIKMIDEVVLEKGKINRKNDKEENSQLSKVVLLFTIIRFFSQGFYNSIYLRVSDVAHPLVLILGCSSTHLLIVPVVKTSLRSGEEKAALSRVYLTLDADRFVPPLGNESKRFR